MTELIITCKATCNRNPGRQPLAFYLFRASKRNIDDRRARAHRRRISPTPAQRRQPREQRAPRTSWLPSSAGGNLSTKLRRPLTRRPESSGELLKSMSGLWVCAGFIAPAFCIRCCPSLSVFAPIPSTNMSCLKTGSDGGDCLARLRARRTACRAY